MKVNIANLIATLFFSMLTMLSLSTQADELRTVLSSAYPAQSSVSFVKHESVVHEIEGEDGSEKYMVLDFQVDSTSINDQQLQASIHSICTTVLTDRQLIEQLSDNGYDMISVSFDSNSQYDCL